ncbi:MAG: hypothetical protein RI894_645 [Bacteroidota bacterium]
METALKTYLDTLVARYNHADFIADDPIQIPHRFTKKQDIEITAFWTAILAWGQRKTIIAKATDLFERMDDAPHDFIRNHSETERKRFANFKHRTFQPDDALVFLAVLQKHYQAQESLETAFSAFLTTEDATVEAALIGFNTYFFADLPPALRRTRKHLASPASGAACKRLCMFLRWMVRNDGNGVDFGLWNAISPAQLVLPLDVHVERQARKLNLLTRTKTDWRAALELTENLRVFSPDDPAKYDFALFGLGVNQEK